MTKVDAPDSVNVPTSWAATGVIPLYVAVTRTKSTSPTLRAVHEPPVQLPAGGVTGTVGSAGRVWHWTYVLETFPNGVIIRFAASRIWLTRVAWSAGQTGPFGWLQPSAPG